MKKFILNLLVLISLLSTLTSCRHYAYNKAKKQMEENLNALLGKSKEYVVLQIGSPTKTEYIAGMEVWTYYKSYGTSSNAYANYNDYGGAYGVGNQWEQYDLARLYFKDNVLIKWDGYVQR